MLEQEMDCKRAQQKFDPTSGFTSAHTTLQARLPFPLTNPQI